MYYMVIRIADGAYNYATSSLHLAASKLVPGTCYGKGRTEIEAINRAQENREYFYEQIKPRNN